MDKIECYLMGVVIASGFITDYSDIITAHDDFELPSHMFQTALNTIYTADDQDDQLENARRNVHLFKGVCNT